MCSLSLSEFTAIAEQVTADYIQRGNGIHVGFVNTPADINEGDCYIWASEVVERAGGRAINLRDLWDDDFDGEGAHAFVEFNGRYHDSEAPEGREYYWQLPFYSR